MPPTKYVKIKYKKKSSILRQAFIRWINHKHRVSDFYVRRERGETGLDGERALAELKFVDANAHLVESTRFVARLAECDGAIVMTEDLRVFGFGAEIKAETKPNVRILDVKDELRKEFEDLDPEDFGLRHRSAIKLLTREPTYLALVVSQDGPISAAYSDDSCLKFLRGVELVNMNMPWA